MDLDATKMKDVSLNTNASSSGTFSAINGRRRLLGVQIAVLRGSENYDIDSPIAKNIIELSNGSLESSGGEVLFTAMVPRSTDPGYYMTQPVNIMLSGRTILFDKGIWWNAITSDGTSSSADGGLLPSLVYMSIYYV